MALEQAAPSALSHFDAADLLDALSTGIMMLDAQLCAVYANVAAQDLLAFSLKQARGRPFGDFLHDAEGLSRILRRALESGEGIADREVQVRPAGAPREVRTLDVTITPLRRAVTGTQLLLEIADTHAAPAHHARERPARAPRRQPPDGPPARARDQESARRPARRGAAARARAAGRPR